MKRVFAYFAKSKEDITYWKKSGNTQIQKKIGR